jgi:hypothetical protein
VVWKELTVSSLPISGRVSNDRLDESDIKSMAVNKSVRMAKLCEKDDDEEEEDFEIVGCASSDVMIFKLFLPKILPKILSFVCSNFFCKNVIITLVFEKNANFFAENRRKLAKIAEICDHNIDPSCQRPLHVQGDADHPG